jgi:homoserine dehydrogenase
VSQAQRLLDDTRPSHGGGCAAAGGLSYEHPLAQAQRARLAEPDPTANVEGHDTVAKVMILSAVVFGRQLRRERVTCRGITGIAVCEAASLGKRLCHRTSIGADVERSAGCGLGATAAALCRRTNVHRIATPQLPNKHFLTSAVFSI